MIFWMSPHYYLLTSIGLKKILLFEELISKRTTVLIHFMVWVPHPFQSNLLFNIYHLIHLRPICQVLNLIRGCVRNFGDLKVKKADGAKLHRPQDALS